MTNYTAKYIEALQKENATGVAIEHAYRPALKNYLEALLTGIIAINDPKRQKCGAPDYIVRKGEIDVGYIEAKDINVGLDKVEKSDQMKRYLESLDNLILTDYLEFRFYRDGKRVECVRIAELGAFFQMNRPQVKAFPEHFEKLETLLADFVGFQGQTIKSPKQLAEMMARKAKLMRDVFTRAIAEEDEDNSLRDQWHAFQEILIHDMDADQFADVYAQTITYGLFTARLHDTTLADFSREEARGLIPRSNPFVRQLFDYVCGANLDHRVVWIVDALCEVYRAADVNAILHNFGRATGRNDPIVHFYEDFLGAYDKNLRKARGVWYTPEPVVNFIVRAVDEVLKTHFKLPDGLADTSKVTIEVDDHHITKKGTAKKKIDVHRVQLLDVAAGTGTFTAEAIKQIYSRFMGQEGMWSSYVEEHLLPRLHGFEILMASYAMCHLKIDLLLQETGYKPKSPNNPPRLGVYLTNALEEHHPDVGTLFASWLAKEANEASRIKKDIPIMVAYGNPPYSVSSQNKGEWIQGLIADYKKDLNEKKINLDDDYIKFIRFAEYHIAKAGSGIVAMITNNSFLDGITHRQMRKHLLETFDHIYILDLHGSAKKKEISPDGSVDKNVFDIQQGVSISIMVKDGSRKGKLAEVKHADLYGGRSEKYEALWSSPLNAAFSVLQYEAPYYFFVPKDFAGEDQYKSGFPLGHLMPSNNSGIKTDRDELFVDQTEATLSGRIKMLLSQNAGADFKNRYKVKDSSSYKITSKILTSQFNEKNIKRVLYRPFSVEHIYYDNTLVSRPAFDVMKHLSGENLLLLTCRQQSTFDFQHVLLTNHLADICTLSSQTKETNYCFPLYLYPDTTDAQTDLINAASVKRKPNLDDKIVAAIVKKLKLPFVPDHENKKADDHSCFSPLDLLDYIYTVLHSPAYRSTYKEFLKIDFPRIPYPSDAAIFWQLVALGGQLRALHLLEHPALGKPITTYPIGGDNMVEKPTYANGKVHINPTQYFGGVPEVAWNFYIGGYQPAQKWLKDRKGRTLSLDDLRHYAKIIIALTETDRLMKKIDAVWKP
jgi:predicted helicase